VIRSGRTIAGMDERAADGSVEIAVDRDHVHEGEVLRRALRRGQRGRCGARAHPLRVVVATAGQEGERDAEREQKDCNRGA
jgi:hypothetical protein